MPGKGMATLDPINIFTSDPRQAFELGAGTALISTRNPQLGHLLLAERNLYYLQILYALLLFRREQELEPLYEDLYDGCREAQSLLEGKDYSLDQFRGDLDQLASWELVSSRLEKRRIRGYRDNRKRKFRFSLSKEALSFLTWLEERLQEDLEDRSVDARNLLEDATHGVSDLLRQLRRFKPAKRNEEQARRVIYQLLKVEEINQAIHVNLSELHARLLGFITRSYNHRELESIIVQLETYLRDFLRKMGALNQEIMPLLETLNRDNNLRKIDIALEVMEEERRRAPNFLRRNRQSPEARNIPRHLLAFHRQGGLLERLTGRIHESAFLVVRKMYAYLRELERKSHRIEDIRDRLAELVTLDEDVVPAQFLFELISPVQMRADPHHWNEQEKADPPRPRKYYEREEDRPRNYLRAKQRPGEPVKSLEMQRMLEVDAWLCERLFARGSRRISRGAYRDYDDFAKLIRLAKAGFLNKGRRLAQVGYKLEPTTDPVEIGLEGRTLAFHDFNVEDIADA